MELEKQQASANESSRSAHHVHVTFVLVLAYIAFAVWSTMHEDLLRGRLVTLPILRVSVPIWSFYVIAPLLLVILHFNLLLRLNFLSSKLLALQDQINALPGPERHGHINLLDDFIFSRFVMGGYQTEEMSRRDNLIMRIHRMDLWLWVRLTVWVLPVALLIWLQLRFVPYHDEFITCFQATMVVLDLLLLWKFRVTTLRKSPRPVPLLRLQRLKTLASRWSQRLGGILIIVGLLSACFLVIVPPPKALEPTWRNWVPEFVRRLPVRNLDLLERNLVKTEPAPEIIAAYYRNGESKEVAWINHARGLDLRSRDLRYANLTRANLINADLRAADLEGANLNGAHVSGARFSLEHNERGPDDTTGARLRGTQWNGVTAPEIFLPFGDLRFASLGGTKWPRAELYEANMLGAITGGLDLRGADLRSAQLQGVLWSNVDLRGADLRYANLSGARLDFSRLQGADLRGASLNGAVLDQTDIGGADLRGASVWNCSAISASLRLTDLRTVTMKPPPDEELKKLIQETARLGEQLEIRLREEGIVYWSLSSTWRLMEAVLRNARNDNELMVATLDEYRNNAIYDDRENAPLASWGTSIAEDEYERKLVEYLVDLACEDSDVASGILFERSLRADGPNLIPRDFKDGSSMQGVRANRGAELYRTMVARGCPSVTQFPPATIEALRNSQSMGRSSAR